LPPSPDQQLDHAFTVWVPDQLRLDVDLALAPTSTSSRAAVVLALLHRRSVLDLALLVRPHQVDQRLAGKLGRIRSRSVGEGQVGIGQELLACHGSAVPS